MLDRADQIDGALNPFAVRLDDRARRAAAAADAALARGEGGPLCGIPLDDQGLALARRYHQRRGLTRHGRICARARRPRRWSGSRPPAPSSTPRPPRRSSATSASPVAAQRPHEQPVGRDPHARRLVGRGCAALAAGAGPLALGGDGGGSIRDPGGVLRAGRLQADVRARAARAVLAELEEPDQLRADGAQRGRCAGHAAGDGRHGRPRPPQPQRRRPRNAGARIPPCCGSSVCEDLGFAPSTPTCARPSGQRSPASRRPGPRSSRTRPAGLVGRGPGRRSPSPTRGTRPERQRARRRARPPLHELRRPCHHRRVHRGAGRCASASTARTSTCSSAPARRYC